GALTGALVGATVALLLAPSSGEELQTRARERFTTVKDEVRQAYEARVAQLETELESLRKRVKAEPAKKA
ncbi:MAG TPA: YtxH domain-containing protein, partial [Anaerolineales bacterium]